ncbi:hypothetical protein GBA52_024430 [Prunus armeniaca]|nr:hypothetical protein GBA52_024430 [Prunus armeniaca]
MPNIPSVGEAASVLKTWKADEKLTCDPLTGHLVKVTCEVLLRRPSTSITWISKAVARELHKSL